MKYGNPNQLNFTAMFEEFDTKHGYVVTNALHVYIEHMREEANNAMAAFDAIKDDPEKRAAQDETLITTMGLFHSSRLFSEAADHAQEALNAYNDMAEETDES